MNIKLYFSVIYVILTVVVCYVVPVSEQNSAATEKSTLLFGGYLQENNIQDGYNDKETANKIYKYYEERIFPTVDKYASRKRDEVYLYGVCFLFGLLFLASYLLNKISTFYLVLLNVPVLFSAILVDVDLISLLPFIGGFLGMTIKNINRSNT